MTRAGQQKGHQGRLVTSVQSVLKAGGPAAWSSERRRGRQGGMGLAHVGTPSRLERRQLGATGLQRGSKRFREHLYFIFECSRPPPPRAFHDCPSLVSLGSPSPTPGDSNHLSAPITWRNLTGWKNILQLGVPVIPGSTARRASLGFGWGPKQDGCPLCQAQLRLQLAGP